MWIPLAAMAFAGSAAVVGGAKALFNNRRCNLAGALVGRREAGVTPARPVPGDAVVTWVDGEYPAETILHDEPSAKKAEPAGAEERRVSNELKWSGAALAITLAAYFSHPLLSLFATPLIVYLEWPIFEAARRDLVNRRGIKIDGLMALFITGAWLVGSYASSAFSIFTYLLAQKITLGTQDRSRTRLIHLFDQQPRSVWRLIDGVELEIPFDEVRAGDTIVVYAGQMIPVDGVVASGMATVDQHRLTGEARPVEKSTGDAVFAATLLVRGALHIRVESAGSDTLAVQIARILEQTTAYHLAVEERGIALAEKSVVPSLVLSAVALPLHGISSAVAVLSAMPGVDMYFAGPLALMNFLHLSARHGILIKDGRSLELLHGVDTVIFDKTGTLTVEQPEVAKVHVWGEIDADRVLMLAAAAEYRQSHPIAQAILAAAEDRKLIVPDVGETRYEVGFGVEVCVDGRTVRVGSLRFMTHEGLVLPQEIQDVHTRCAEFGHSLVLVGVDDRVAGALELRPTLRPETLAVVAELRKRDLRLVILSGDRIEPTRHLAERLGIDAYFAEVLPEDKARYVETLQAEGRSVCFVGDGINDAIALKKANVSVSLRGATTIATDSAQIVLMEQSLDRLPLLFDLARSLERNLMTSFGMSVGTGGVIVASVFFFHAGVGAVVGFGSCALLGIVGNAMLPLLATLKKDGAGSARKESTLLLTQENDR